MRYPTVSSWMVCLAFLLAHPRPAAAGEAATVEAGLGDGVTVRSADGRFSLTTRLRMQARAVWTETDAGNTLGAEIRRMRLVFRGQFLPEWQYDLQFGFANGDTEPDLRLPLRDALVTWSGLRDLNVRFGQGKVPFNHQRVVSSSALQLVDRSLSNAEFNLDRDVGVQLLSNDLFGWDGRLGYAVGVFGGEGRNRNVLLNDGVLSVARLQWKPLGGFEDPGESDLSRDSRPRLALQVAGALNRGTSRARSTFDTTYSLGTYDYAHASADVVFKLRGLSVQLEGLYREALGTKRREGAGGQVETSRSGWGFHAQGGYMLGEQLELVGRLGQVRPLGQITAVKPLGEYGGGLTWFAKGHAFKVQADAFWLTGEALHDGHAQVRLQAQLSL